MSASSAPTALTIAGSDPSGGAGLQADLKTFAALGVYGMSALTLATVGNTEGVTDVYAMPVDVVAAQIDAVCRDIPPAAVKTGMLYSAPIIRAVSDAIDRHGLAPLVVDPVMTTRRGDRLLSDEAEAALVDLVARAVVVTPSRPEAERLAQRPIASRRDVERAAEAIFALGPRSVVITGGHTDEPAAADLFFDGEAMAWLTAERIPHAMHGAGDTFSAAIAAGLARGRALATAVREAKAFVTEAIRHAPPRGHGTRPLVQEWQQHLDGPLSEAE